MDIVFEALYFLAIGLLAITITVFVLAVSLLGRAIKLSLEDQEKAEKELKEANEKEMSKIQGELDKARKESKQLNRKSLEKSLKDLEQKNNKHDRTLTWIRWKPKFLKTNWGVFIPGVFFIVVVCISALARYQLSQHNTDYQYYYLGASVFALLLGIGFICLTLKVIEGVAVTSDEISFTRETEAVKKALLEVEEVKRPKLEFQFKDENPPFHLKIGQTKTFSVGLALTDGEAAQNPVISISAPQGFDFPSMVTTLQPKNSIHPGNIDTSIRYKTCILGYMQEENFTIKAPNKKGNYKLYLSIYCENSPKKEIEFGIIVE